MRKNRKVVCTDGRYYEMALVVLESTCWPRAILRAQFPIIKSLYIKSIRGLHAQKNQTLFAGNGFDLLVKSNDSCDPHIFV